MVVNISDMAGIQLRIWDGRAHSFLEIDDRLHEPLPRIFRKVILFHPSIPPGLKLTIAIGIRYIIPIYDY